MMIKKVGYAVQMSFDIPAVDKETASKAEKYFNHLNSLIEKAKKHFNILYEPFKDNSDVSTEETIKNRAALRKYREQIVDNFNDIKKTALDCYKIMDYFSSDTETHEIMTAFIEQLDSLEKQVNLLIDVFSNLSSQDFKNSIIKAIDNVKKECVQLSQLIDDRILNHIDTNILAKNWVSNVTNEMNTKIDDKIPAIVQLYQERQKAVNKAANFDFGDF